jgi:hypothetical protein
MPGLSVVGTASIPLITGMVMSRMHRSGLSLEESATIRHLLDDVKLTLSQTIDPLPHLGMIVILSAFHRYAVFLTDSKTECG